MAATWAKELPEECTLFFETCCRTTVDLAQYARLRHHTSAELRRYVLDVQEKFESFEHMDSDGDGVIQLNLTFYQYFRMFQIPKTN